MSPPQARWRLAALAATLVLAVSGCGKDHLLLPNQSPVVVLEKAVPYAAEGRIELHLKWSGHDPDGSVDHYLFALDPESVVRAGPGWTKTREVGTSIAIRRRAMPTSGMAQDTDNGEPSIFAVCAVDAAGAVSAPATVAFFGSNIAPEVTIVDPIEGILWPPLTIGTAVNVRWTGRDLDGTITKYKYRLFEARNPDVPSIPNFVTWAIANPDSFRRLYAPTFAGWDSVGPDVQSARYEGLVPGEAYLFAVTAFDNGGAYTPFGGGNVLRFHVTQEGPHLQPRIKVTTPLFEFESLTGRDVDLSYELPFHAAIPATWSATPVPGSLVQDYRWVLDPLDASDEKPRSHPTADPNHWTPWSLENTSTTIGPFRSARDLHSEHVLHIQARDIFNRVGTIRIHFTLVSPKSERDLLVVDDTRLTPDQVVGGILQPPRGNWPTAAELDTFLYARGGFPWRGYPPGTVSTPGLLAGYDFDTLGTRGIPDGIVPLSVLGRYRHVMWLTDDFGPTYVGSPLDPLAPITSLRLMNRPGGWMNTLAAYVREGGQLWLSGGLSGFASTIAWQNRSTPPNEFTNADGELIPGRFMYDFTHWRSGFRLTSWSGALVFNHSSLLGPTSAPGRGWAGQPNYDKLLTAAPYLSLRSPATDPTPPLRNDASFFFSFFQTEHLFLPNVIVEDMDPRPNHERLESTLDSLYVLGRHPVMTYYHGQEGGSVVFSGFQLWSFQRTQAAALTDFVLQDIWGLTRRTPALASRR